MAQAGASCAVQDRLLYWHVGSCAPLPLPARRGYGYGSCTPVARGTAVAPVQACRFLRAAPPPARRSPPGTAQPAGDGAAVERRVVRQRRYS